MLLHALAILLFGAPSGGSREGRAMWGSLDVVIRSAPLDAGPRLRVEREISVPAKPVAPKPAGKKAAPPPKAVPVPRPADEGLYVFPPLLERYAPPEIESQATFKVPPPTRLQRLPAEAPIPVAPLIEPLASPVEPVQIAPLETVRVPSEAPIVPVPLLQPLPPVRTPELALPVEPAPAPAIERVPVDPVLPPPVVVEKLPAPRTESIAPPPVGPVSRPSEPALPSEPAPPAPRESAPTKPPPPVPAERPPLPELRAPVGQAPAVPAAPPGPAAPSTDSLFRRRDEPATDYDPTAAPSRLDPEALRKRAGEIAREGTGRRALLPFPMPPLPERKTREQIAIEKARKPDCRTAYQSLGLAAIVPLIANEFGEGSCRW